MSYCPFTPVQPNFNISITSDMHTISKVGARANFLTSLWRGNEPSYANVTLSCNGHNVWLLMGKKWVIKWAKYVTCHRTGKTWPCRTMGSSGESENIQKYYNEWKNMYLRTDNSLVITHQLVGLQLTYFINILVIWLVQVMQGDSP